MTQLRDGTVVGLWPGCSPKAHRTTRRRETTTYLAGVAYTP